MAKVTKDDLLEAAAHFVEAMREDFHRSFELIDFRS